MGRILPQHGVEGPAAQGIPFARVQSAPAKTRHHNLSGDASAGAPIDAPPRNTRVCFTLPDMSNESSAALGTTGTCLEPSSAAAPSERDRGFSLWEPLCDIRVHGA